MSAEVLRRAASLMRERADNLVGDPAQPWEIESECYCQRYDDAMETGGCQHRSIGYNLRVGTRNGISHQGAQIHHEEEANYIASWHPVVALAIVDWLEAEADFLAAHGRAVSDERKAPALAVAFAYLGDDQ